METESDENNTPWAWLALAVLVPVVAVLVLFHDTLFGADPDWTVDKSCHEMTDMFGPESRLKSVEQLQMWQQYARKDFEWSLTVVSSRQDNGFGFVDYVCEGSPSMIGTIRVFYPGSYVAKHQPAHGTTRVVRAQLNSKLMPSHGLLADALPDSAKLGGN